MRANPTAAEKRLWFGLRNLRTFKFRRQHRAGSLIVDFYCAEVSLAVELDGSAHSGSAAMERDARRDCRLRELGFRVIHIRNEEVFGGLGVTVRMIEDVCCFF